MTKDELEKGQVYYNYSLQKFPSEERPGTSVFFKDGAGNIFPRLCVHLMPFVVLVMVPPPTPCHASTPLRRVPWR